MLSVRRMVKSLLPDSLHAGALRAENRLRVAGAGLVAWRRPQDQITKTAKENLRRSVRRRDSSLPVFGDRWNGYARELRRRLPTLRSAEELINYGQSPMAGIESHLRGESLRAYIDRCITSASDVPSGLLEHFSSFNASSLVSERIVTRYRGARLDANLVNVAITILRLISMLRDELPKTVCDIGGGIGVSTLSWLKNTAHRPEYVTIIDLPETLIFADALLRHELGNAEVRYLLDDRAIDPAAVGAKVLLCPISNVSALRPLEFDLVTNTFSMQEMTDEWVDWYMRWLDMQPCRYFYSANFFGTALARMREGRNSWSPRPSSGWSLQRFWVSDDDGDRPMAMQMFKKTSKESPAVSGSSSRLDGWLTMLDRVRMNQCRDVNLLERSLRYGLELSPIPKETWHLARATAALTDDPWAKSIFVRLSHIRRRQSAMADTR